jgi:hypothetical protein
VGFRGYGFLEGSYKDHPSAKGWGYLFFSQGERKPWEVGQFCVLKGFKKLKK